MGSSSFFTGTTGYTQINPAEVQAFVDEAEAAAAAASASAASAAASVQAAAGTATPLVDGVAAVGTGVKWAREDHVHPTDTSRASATALALKADTTYVDTQDAALTTSIALKADTTYVDTQDAALTTAIALKAATTYVDSQDAALTAAIALKAPLASPALTGTPTAPTASPSDNSTKIATTAYVDTQVAASPGGREVLTAARTYYVRTDGSDSNNGLTDTSGGAFLTIQGGFNKFRALIDTRGYTVTIKVADGTYTGAVSITTPLVGGGSLVIEGNTTTPANAIVSTTSANAFSASGDGICTVKGFKVQTTTAGDCVTASLGGWINFQDMDFGACAGSHISGILGGSVTNSGNWTISGSAPSHLHSYAGGRISLTSATVTLTGTPAFSDFFAGVANANIGIAVVTFSGSATGKRYYAHKNGVVDVNSSGETYLPGNVAGTVDGGGRYVGGTEGWQSYTATVTSGSGTFTTPPTAIVRYQKINGCIKLQMRITIGAGGTLGTAAGALIISLPFANGLSSYPSLPGYIFNTAEIVNSSPGPGDTTLSIVKSGGATPITASYIIQMAGEYAY